MNQKLFERLFINFLIMITSCHRDSKKKLLRSCSQLFSISSFPIFFDAFFFKICENMQFSPFTLHLYVVSRLSMLWDEMRISRCPHFGKFFFPDTGASLSRNYDFVEISGWAFPPLKMHFFILSSYSACRALKISAKMALGVNRNFLPLCSIWISNRCR